MKKKVLFCLFITIIFNSKVLTQEGFYLSPGVQIGIDSKGNLFRATQITLGFLIEEVPFTFGLTIGNKWFRKSDKIGKESWSRYSYFDLQSHSLESIIQPGIGFGLIRGDNIPLTPRFKIWAGWFVLPSYEFINMNNDYYSKHYYGLFGV